MGDAKEEELCKPCEEPEDPNDCDPALKVVFSTAFPAYNVLGSL